MWRVKIMSTSEIALRWMSQIIFDGKPTLVQVMASCHQARSHYLSQCWLTSMLPCGITRPQWAKSFGMANQFHPTLYNRYNHVSIMRLKLIHVSERGPRQPQQRNQNDLINKMVADVKVVPDHQQQSCSVLLTMEWLVPQQSHYARHVCIGATTNIYGQERDGDRNHINPWTIVSLCHHCYNLSSSLSFIIIIISITTIIFFKI